MTGGVKRSRDVDYGTVWQRADWLSDSPTHNLLLHASILSHNINTFTPPVRALASPLAVTKRWLC